MNDDLIKQLSNILENNNINLNDILTNLNNTGESNENSEDTPPNESQIDTETIIKFQKLLKILNNKKSSSDEQLLKALKPYMRPSRKEKIEQYIKILHIMKIFEEFKQAGGNINDFL